MAQFDKIEEKEILCKRLFSAIFLKYETNIFLRQRQKIITISDK